METMQLQPVRANIYPGIITAASSFRTDTQLVVPEAPIMKGALEGSMLIERQLPFIEANTREVTMQHLKNDCLKRREY